MGTQESSPFEFYTQWKVAKTTPPSIQQQENTPSARELEMQETLKRLLEALDKQPGRKSAKRSELMEQAKACCSTQEDAEPQPNPEPNPRLGETKIYSLRKLQLQFNSQDLGNFASHTFKV